METIKNLLTGIFFWSFLLGASIFGVLGYQMGSYKTYSQCTHHPKSFNTPKFKYTFHNNVFYKLYQYADPKKFDDVKKYEKQELEKEYSNKLKEINSSN